MSASKNAILNTVRNDKRNSPSPSSFASSLRQPVLSHKQKQSTITGETLKRQYYSPTNRYNEPRWGGSFGIGPRDLQHHLSFQPDGALSSTPGPASYNYPISDFSSPPRDQSHLTTSPLKEMSKKVLKDRQSKIVLEKPAPSQKPEIPKIHSTVPCSPLYNRTAASVRFSNLAPKHAPDPATTANYQLKENNAVEMLSQLSPRDLQRFITNEDIRLAFCTREEEDEMVREQRVREQHEKLELKLKLIEEQEMRHANLFGTSLHSISSQKVEEEDEDNEDDDYLVLRSEANKDRTFTTPRKQSTKSRNSSPSRSPKRIIELE